MKWMEMGFELQRSISAKRRWFYCEVIRITSRRMEERRRCTTVRQLELMVEFLEGHRDLALGRVRSKEARAVASRLWAECAEIINVEGPLRTSKEWAKVWNDLKCRVRAKLVSINASQQATGGGPSNAPVLTPLEERVANILGRDVGPLPNVRQDPFNVNDNVVVAEEDEVAEYVVQEARNVSPVVAFNNDDYITIEDVDREIVSPAPSVVGIRQAAPSPSSRVTRVTNRRRAERASHQRTARSQPAPAQSNKTALDESRTMIMQIEKMRAEAALKNAEATKIFAESFKLVAESIDRFSQKYCHQQAGAARPPGSRGAGTED